MGIIIASCGWPGRKGLRLSHEEMGQSHTQPSYSALTPGWQGTKAKRLSWGRVLRLNAGSVGWESLLIGTLGEGLHHAKQQRS